MPRKVPDKAYQRNFLKKLYDNRKKEAIQMLGGKCSECEVVEGLQIQFADKNGGYGSFWGKTKAVFYSLVKTCKLFCNDHYKSLLIRRRGLVPAKEAHGTWGALRYCGKCDKCREFARTIKNPPMIKARSAKRLKIWEERVSRGDIPVGPKPSVEKPLFCIECREALEEDDIGSLHGECAKVRKARFAATRNTAAIVLRGPLPPRPPPIPRPPRPRLNRVRKPRTPRILIPQVVPKSPGQLLFEKLQKLRANKKPTPLPYPIKDEEE